MQLHFSCEVARLARQRPAEEDASIRSFGAHEFRVAHRGGSQPGGENATPPGLFGRRMSGRLLGLLGFHRDSRIQPPGTCLPAAPSLAEHFVGRYMRAHCSIREDGKPPPPSASSQCHETQPTSSSPWRALDSSTRPIPREISKESWNCS